MDTYRMVCGPGGERLDKAIHIEGLTRGRIQALIADGDVLVNGRAQKASYRVAAGDVVEVRVPAPEPLDAQPEQIPLDIVYEDDDLLVVNKPQGMVVHPAPGNYHGTLVNALLYHCGGSLTGIGGTARPGIVHRIDKDTSGLLLVAKTELAHQSLSAQIKDKTVVREYVCIVSGHLPAAAGKIDAPIGRHPASRVKMAVTEKNSKPAVTHFTVLRQLGGADYVQCRLETGRTHQIRVHLAYLGHPILGDRVYGDKRNPYHLPGQALHAKKIGFVHPRTGKYYEFEQQPPSYFTELLEKLEYIG